MVGSKFDQLLSRSQMGVANSQRKPEVQSQFRTDVIIVLKYSACTCWRRFVTSMLPRADLVLGRPKMKSARL